MDNDTSELYFRHHRLNDELECIGVCARSWNHYLMTSLREYLEGGSGSPIGSPKDRACRRAEGRG